MTLPDRLSTVTTGIYAYNTPKPAHLTGLEYLMIKIWNII